MSAEIAERCQQAINRLHVNITDSPHIVGVCKLVKSFRLRFETEEATTVHKLNETKDDFWNVAFEGLKIHLSMYGIAVHGISIADLSKSNNGERCKDQTV
jgi:predicted SpoU family rRNA methylase